MAHDLSDPHAIAAMMSDIHTQYGTVDILVNNAGIQHVAPTQDFPPEAWDKVLAINLSSAFHTSRLALPAMQQQGWGRIINIASAHGLVASANKSAYVAAKHGLLGLTKAIALENARSNITCNAICPGWVLTPLVQAQIEARAQREHISVDAAKTALLAEKQPSQEFVTPEQIGEIVYFLCSDAAQQVRGAAWSVDGGWTAQ
jgi:3-hydroxybutyrate dehydrogenase